MITIETLQELTLHVQAISAAVEANPTFFASVKHYVNRLNQLLMGGEAPSQSEIQLLVNKLDEFWAKWRPTGGGLYIPPRVTEDTDSTVRRMVELATELRELDAPTFEQQVRGFAHEAPGPGKRVGQKSTVGVVPACVFIGHGRSKLWARLKMFLEDELGLATVTYESEPRTGESIVPVLERMLEQATFAALVLTAEDEGPEGARRARQNVVHEAGLFQGRLGFKKAVLLVQNGIEGFSNVDGLQHIRFADEQIEQAFYELQRVLKREKQLKSG